MQKNSFIISEKNEKIPEVPSSAAKHTSVPVVKELCVFLRDIGPVDVREENNIHVPKTTYKKAGKKKHRIGLAAEAYVPINYVYMCARHDVLYPLSTFLGLEM